MKFRDFVVSTLLSVCAFAQNVGPNVNMVTGTGVGDGDPFLQRQNETSIAVSSRNPRHILAVANDYRLVDIPGLLGTDELGDVWLGVFRSIDGGATWSSAVLPGCPQSIPACQDNSGSPLPRRQAAADGTIRPGPAGMFHMSGISFDRGKNALGNVFVSSWVDLNNKENGNPFAYLGAKVIDSGTSGQFLDKPWIATALSASPRTCTIGGTNGIPAQTIPAYNVYVVFSKFTGSGNNANSQILFSRSTDCGATYSNPTKLSESNSLNQGTTMTVNPKTGEIHVAWRRSANSQEPDAIMVTKSLDEGRTFVGPAAVAVTFAAGVLFDQPRITGGELAFRAKAFPTIAADGDGRVYVAWSQRGLAPAPFQHNARIVVAASDNGLTFPSNRRVVADNNAGGGFQFMPSLAFAGGRLMLIYYDSRDDQTKGQLRELGGGAFEEVRVPIPGSDPTRARAFSTQYVSDDRRLGLSRLRTIDVRGIQAIPGAIPGFQQSLKISQYRYGTKKGVTTNVFEQLEFNPPNLPMFSQGTASFIGDYIEVAGPVYLPGPNGTWVYNTNDIENAVFHATWADNRNVRPPASGNWSDYTPVASTGGLSLFDPAQPRPACRVGLEATRNQDVYTARITQGVSVTALGNDKPLGTSLQRAYSVQLQNQTRAAKSFRLSTTQPAPCPAPAVSSASFSPIAPVPSLIVKVAPRSSVARALFVQSPCNAAPTVRVSAAEVDEAGTVIAGGLIGSTSLNADTTNPSLVKPDPVTNGLVFPEVFTAEVYYPEVYQPEVYQPEVYNAEITYPEVYQPEVYQPEVYQPEVYQPEVYVADIAQPEVYQPEVYQPEVYQPEVYNPEITRADVASGYSDTTWTFRNLGNTSASYLTKLLARDDVKLCTPGCTATGTCAPGCVKLQLILHKRLKTPVAGAGANACKLLTGVQPLLLSNVTTPQLSPLATITDSSAANGEISNATVAVSPGEEMQLTVRAFGKFNTSRALGPVIVAQTPNTPEARAPLTLAITTFRLPDGFGTRPYFAKVNIVGSIAAPAFALVTGQGSLPPGLVLDPATGDITGTPTVNGTYNFVVRVTEDPVNLPVRNATQPLSIRVVDALIPPPAGTSLPPAGLNQPYSARVAVQGGIEPLTFELFSGQLPPGLVLGPTSGLIAGTPTVGGTFTFVVKVTDSSCATASCAPQLIQVTLAIVVDATAPVVTPVITGTLGANGWYTSAVNLSWNISDPDSQIANLSAGCSPKLVTASENITCTVTNGAGLVTVAPVGLKVDTTPPVVTPTVTGTQGANGWYTSAVTVTWSVTDPESGISSACATASLTAATAGETVSCTARNQAGLETSASVVVKIDLDSPALQFTRTPAANGAGWNNTPVTFTFTCSDGGAGAGAPPAPYTFTGQGANQTHTATCTDAAGRTASVTVTASIDLTAPALVATRTPAANAAGWNNTDVTVTFACTDALSGVAESTGAQVVTAEGANQTRAGTCTDRAGNTASTTVGSISIDKTPPTAVITTPQQGVVYPLGGSFVAGYNCGDALSGLASCVGSAAAGATVTLNTPGARSFSVTATDLAGNVLSVSRQYSVGYQFNGFQTPLQPAGTFSGTQTLGRAVPLKWDLPNPTGGFFRDLALVTNITTYFNGPRAGAAPCSLAITGTPFLLYQPTAGATGGSTFRISGNTYTFNWDTSTGAPTGPGCYTVAVQLNDGAPPRVTSVELK
ncbi:MAG: putative Ig domain-containing protein [Bryobacteraceae bacterium]|nr:putative Ig domain-containing protein [Bryobacteraceae bacterium]